MQKVYILGTKHFIKEAKKNFNSSQFLVSSTDNVELFKFQVSELSPGESIIILDEDKIFNNTFSQIFASKKNLLSLQFIHECPAFSKHISSSFSVFDYEDISDNIWNTQSGNNTKIINTISTSDTNTKNNNHPSIADIESQLMLEDEVFDIPNLIAIANGEIEDPADEEFDLESIIREMNQGNKKPAQKKTIAPEITPSQNFDNDDIEAIIAQSLMEKTNASTKSNISLEDIISETIAEELLLDDSVHQNDQTSFSAPPLPKTSPTAATPMDELSKTLRQLSTSGKINIVFSKDPQDNLAQDEIISKQLDEIEQLKQKIAELSNTMAEYTPITGSNTANDDIDDLVKKAERAKRLSIDLTLEENKNKGPEDEDVLIEKNDEAEHKLEALPENDEDLTSEQASTKTTKNKATKTLAQNLLETLSEDDIFKMISEGKL